MVWGALLAPKPSLPWIPTLVHREQLPESAYMHQLLGLNLLFLLSQNRVAEFHTELERLPAKDIQTNVYIKHPVSLEQVRLRKWEGRAWLKGAAQGETLGRVSWKTRQGSACGLICPFVQQILSPSHVHRHFGWFSDCTVNKTDQISDLMRLTFI